MGVSIDYNKYIYSSGTHYISNSGGDSRGKTSGDRAGDQNGKEWQLRSWYNRPWSCVLRHPDPVVRRLLAELGIEGALNDLIGYDQGQRITFWSALALAGYRPANITTACEEDCSAGVSGCVKAAGYLLNNEALKGVSASNNTSTIKAALKKAGFEVLTASKYRTSGNYLLPGDVLLYEEHHVAINITRGSKAVGEVADSVNVPPPVEYKLGDRILKNGAVGADVKELQTALQKLGYSVGSAGIDGEFGDDTETAVKAFQRDHGLEVDGEAGEKTVAALRAAGGGDVPDVPDAPAKNALTVKAGTWNVRTGPGQEYPAITALAGGAKLTPVSTDGWQLITYDGALRWISKNAIREGE